MKEEESGCADDVVMILLRMIKWYDVVIVYNR